MDIKPTMWKEEEAKPELFIRGMMHPDGDACICIVNAKGIKVDKGLICWVASSGELYRNSISKHLADTAGIKTNNQGYIEMG